MGIIRIKGVLSSWKGRVLRASAVPWQDHWTARAAMVSFNLKWIGANSLILVGDSILEMVPQQALEGLNIVNAGFGGATAANVYASINSPVVLSALKANPPLKAIIQAGTNDSTTRADPGAVSGQVMSICSLFLDMGTVPVVFAIPPIEEKKTAFRSAAAADAINIATRAASLKNAVTYIDPYASLRGLEDVTEDGIHLSRKAIVALVEAIRAA
ncbi:SGNH/GDSL hydrolase family protein [Mesorhizobium sp.]|uniref:SGNH/GDSL hydrolase family protein n=1 Tax=Mesorhizobium sp. TaxID=1871066 RepID=UPI0012106233|nr:SGNH/GDSL hydrolase family protein [Mesorhizobium sp.]TIN80002.1 MAG: hypothetical protein E5Y09_06320 [Mesorhizobium sp.]